MPWFFIIKKLSTFIRYFVTNNEIWDESNKSPYCWNVYERGNQQRVSVVN